MLLFNFLEHRPEKAGSGVRRSSRKSKASPFMIPSCLFVCLFISASNLFRMWFQGAVKRHLEE